MEGGEEREMEFQLRQIDKRKAYREILEIIWQSIHRYGLRPGDKLPPEKDLANQLKVARPTLREALSVLDYMGIVESVQGGGYYVKSMTPNDFNGLVAGIGRSVSPYELVVARLTVEPEICKVAAAKREEEDVAYLGGVLNRIEQKVSQGINPSEEDLEFHLGVARATGNIILISIVEALLSLKKQVFYEAIQEARYRHNPRLDDIRSDHESIFKAIKDKQEDEASRFMKRHLLRVKEDLFDALEEG